MGCDLPAEPQMEFVRKALGFLEDGQTSCPSFFCILGLCKRDKNFVVVSQNNKISHKELRLLLHCVTMNREGE